jgi:hypothetical protein
MSERLLLFGAQALSKARNPFADGKNIRDRAGNRPKTNSFQVQRGAVGVEWPLFVPSAHAAFQALPLHNNMSSACVTSVAYPVIFVCSKKIVSPFRLWSCSARPKSWNAVLRMGLRRVKDWTSPARDRIELG